MSDEDEDAFLDDPDEGLVPVAGPPLVPARDCPEEQLPAGALAFMKAARSNSWTATARIAVAWDGMTSVIVRARRNGVLLVACWECPVGGKWAFSTGWRHPGRLGLPDSLTITELKAAL